MDGLIALLWVDGNASGVRALFNIFEYVRYLVGYSLRGSWLNDVNLRHLVLVMHCQLDNFLCTLKSITHKMYWSFHKRHTML